MKKIATYSGCIFLLTVMLAACNQGPAGIFATIEETQKVDQNRGMPGQATIMSLSVHEQDHLIAVTGRQLLHRKVQANSSWEQIPIPEDYSYVLDAEIFGSTEGNSKSYAVFLFSSTEKRSLYIVELDSVLNHSGGSLGLGSPVTAGIEHEIHALYRSGDSLYVTVNIDGDSYGLYVISMNGDAWGSSEVLAADGDGNHVFGGLSEIVAIDGRYVLSRDALYELGESGVLLAKSGLIPAPATEADNDDDESNIQYMDMKLLGDEIYVVSNRKLYHGNVDVDETLEFISLPDLSTHKNILSVSALSYGSTDMVFVGTQNSGFLAFENGELISPRSSSVHHINFGGTALSRIPVQTIRMIQKPDELAYMYAGTAGNGLWEGVIQGTGDDVTITWGKE